MEGQGQGGAGGLAHAAGGAAGKDQSQQQVTWRPPPPKEQRCMATRAAFDSLSSPDTPSPVGVICQPWSAALQKLYPGVELLQLVHF